jgi:hypothetical protein
LNLFLKEFDCPYEQLSNNSLNEGNFNDKELRLLVIFYLTSELQAAIINNASSPIETVKKSLKVTSPLKNLALLNYNKKQLNS